CEGLNEAHNTGVIHRDIKPGNIIIDSKGNPRLLDFGLATVAGEEKLTKTGSTLGTVGYMSPEQIEGKQVDHRSDLFSVGVIFYEMLTGRRPFEGDNDAAVARSITDTTPEPVARYKSGTTGELQQIVDKALSKDPFLRYQTAAGMLADLKRLDTVSTRNVRRPLLWLFASAALVVLAATYLLMIKDTDTADSVIRIAVLPFENLGLPEDEFFADGITDEITSRLAKLSKLGVISRTSAVQYKNTEKGIPQIGEELGVDYILEGTIRWDKTSDTDKVRITPQLIAVEDNIHLWADNYERNMDAIFQVQVDIASQIVAALDLSLHEPERKALEEIPTDNIDAYHAYLAGWKNWTDSLGLQMFQRAVELDSGFALAYASLSRAHTALYHYGVDRSQQNLKRAKQAAEHALELEPNLAEAHIAMGYYYYQGYRQYDKALEAFDKAEGSLPNDSRILNAKAMILRRYGQFEEAITNMERAVDRSPRYSFALSSLGETYTVLREFRRALEYYDKVITIAPAATDNYRRKAQTLLFSGDVNTARSVLENAPASRSETVNARMLPTWMMIELYDGEYQAALDRLDKGALDFYWNVWSYAWPKHLMAGLIYRFMGDDEKANASFTNALSFLESHEQEYKDHHGYYSALGITYGGLGQRELAVQTGQMALERWPVTKDALVGAARTIDLARIYVLVEDYDEAITLLGQMLELRAWGLTPATLRLDPIWNPLRNQARFQAMIERYQEEHGT
ncbi:MAG: protein kinase, partial [Candidatus Zixiibacteriota bacterium]